MQECEKIVRYMHKSRERGHRTQRHFMQALFHASESLLRENDCNELLWSNENKFSRGQHRTRREKEERVRISFRCVESVFVVKSVFIRSFVQHATYLFLIRDILLPILI